MDAVEVFNSLPAERLTEDLLACCAAPAWGAEVAAKRPYRDRPEILAAADAAARGLSWDDVLVGLSAHPRIGERAPGDSKEAAWSRREQSTAVRSADEATKDALVEVNRAYEDRFGHVFLIFASGRTEAEFHAKISTHILDTVTGDPARDVYVRLERHDSDGWRTIAEGRTDGDGRLRYRVPVHEWQAGGYRLFFYVEPYLGGDSFFPEITVAFHVHDPQRHYHVPLLLSRYGYTTYRGS